MAENCPSTRLSIAQEPHRNRVNEGSALGFSCHAHYTHVSQSLWRGLPGGMVVKEGNAMGVVVEPSARETFTPRELAAAYKEFLERGPQHLDAESGISASAYRFGERLLIVYEESEPGVVVLIHPTSRN